MTEQSKIEEKLASVEEKITENSLAFEMVKDQKKTNKRFFITLLVILCLWFVTTIAQTSLFVWYISQFEYCDNYSVCQQNTDGLNQVSGGDALNDEANN